MHPVWHVLAQSQGGRLLLQQPRAQTLTVRYQPLPTGSNARYYSTDNIILVADAIRHERLAAQAAILIHEVWHAVSPIPYPRDFTACVADEVWAFGAQSALWLELAPGSPVTRLEQGIVYTMQLWGRDRGARNDFDTDVSDFRHLLPHVLYERDYVTRCAA